MLILYDPTSQPIPIPDGVDPAAIVGFLILVGQVALAWMRQRGFDSHQRWEKRQRDEKRQQDSQSDRQQAADAARQETSTLFERLLAIHSETIAELRERLKQTEVKRDSFLQEKVLLEDELDQVNDEMRDCRRERDLALKQVEIHQQETETYKVRLDMMTAARDGVLVRASQLEGEKARLEMALKRHTAGAPAPVGLEGAKVQAASLQALLTGLIQHLETLR